MSVKRNEIITLLEKKAFDELIKLSVADKKTISTLISLSYDKDDRLSWRAIEVIGLASKEISKHHPEAVRNIAGRLLWMMRDESGGIAWSAPEILGEIVRNNPVLCSDFAPIIASCHDEKMLCAGVLWALGRIGYINDDTLNYAGPIVCSYLRSPDERLRGYAAWAIGEMGVNESENELADLKQDMGLINYYEDGELHRKTVGEIASAALMKIRNRQN
ncbi:MAG: hypothetical protein C4538_08245 [Nitrospiraceae bacterium]|nr:MAG: hypothetical protein C4538_08245 [Nitrospiraceae bacterium]